VSRLTGSGADGHEYETITREDTDGAAIITMRRPDVMNALNTQMRAEITHAVGTAGTEARVVVLTGEGRAFCSGQDLGDRANVANINLERTLRDEYIPMLMAIVDCPVPVIAAVNGTAAGAGANLALVCDVVIATASASFIQAFSRIGLIPDAGGTWALPRQVGLARAMGASLFAEKISAAEAASWGMIWEAVEDESFEEVWRARAAHLAQGPTEAYKRVKQALHASFGNSLQEQLLLEGQLQGQCGRTRDFKEGVMAFLEKRPASSRAAEAFRGALPPAFGLPRSLRCQDERRTHAPPSSWFEISPPEASRFARGSMPRGNRPPQRSGIRPRGLKRSTRSRISPMVKSRI
jgi:2-(1,2-epoxy-1,2-dihydrophenyl)acetyl-CoA isomerase